MPSSNTATNPKGTEIVFEEKSHKYYSMIRGKEVVYTSVTTYVGKFFKPFAAEETAKRIAEKRGTTPEALLKEWAENSAAACRYGTRVHECCEDTLKNRELRCKPENDKETLAFANAVKIANQIRDSFDVIGIEKLIFDEELKLAGTIDLLLKSKKQPNTYVICDWKTNKEINDQSKYNEHALYPIESLDDCETTHYGLQLGLYAHILKSGGYIPSDAEVKTMIVHITPIKNNIITLNGYEPFVERILNFKNGNI